MKLFLNIANKSQSEISWNKSDYLMRAARRLGFDWVVPLTQKGLHEEAQYVLNIEPFDRFHKGTRWTGIWEIDVLCDRAAMSPSNWAESDDVFLAVSTLPSRLKGWEHKTHLLLQATDPLHRRIESIPQEYDFVLCGTGGLDIYKKRDAAIELLRKKFTFCDKGKGHSLAEYVERLNCARVQFIRSMSTPIGDGEIAQRFFECLAIGPVLTNYCTDLLYTGLEEGVDYLSYKSDSEMVDKMRALISDPTLRDTIARNGRRKALLNHTYEHRLISIINVIHAHDVYSLH